MRRAILHVGTPRTGTTSLQAVLHAHREEMVGQGILYPDLTPRSAPSPHWSHQHLGEALRERRSRRERAELLAALDQALADTHADIALLSYEGLCLLPAWSRAPHVLAELFFRRGFQLEILATLKSQSVYAQSQYAWRCQFLRERRCFSEFLRRDISDSRYDYTKILRTWGRAAAGRVRAVPVHDRRSHRPLIERIMSELDIAERLKPILTSADVGRSENRSLGPVAIETCRRLTHRRVAPERHDEARQITRFIQAEARARGFDKVPFQALDAEIVDKLRSRFAASNDRFSKRVWGKAWSECVAPVPLTPPNEIASGALDPPTSEQIDSIVETACARFNLRAEGQSARAFSWIRRKVLPRW